MSIEFIGLPGSGKSRICFFLSDALRKEPGGGSAILFPPVDHEPRSKVIFLKLIHSLYFLVLHPRIAARFVNLVRRNGQKSRRRGITKTLHLFSEMGRQSRYQGKNPIFEQGVLQAIWSISVGAERHDIAGMVSLARPFLPNFVVFVETEREELHRRIEQRTGGRSRVDRLGRVDREALLKRTKGLLSDLFKQWKESSRDHRFLVIRNTNESDPEAHVAAILASLRDRPVDPVGTNTLSWITRP